MCRPELIIQSVGICDQLLVVSELDNIPGVGAVSREKLVAKYKTVSKIKKAPYREVVNVIGKRAADALFGWFALDKS